MSKVNYRWLRGRFKPMIGKQPKEGLWLSISEASKRSGKSKQIIRIWAMQGEIDCYMDLELKKLLIYWCDLEKKLKKRINIQIKI